MEPVFGFALYAALCVVVAVIANKRGRSGLIFFLVCAVGGPAMVMMIGATSGGSGVAAATGAFLVPVVALVVALSSKTGGDMAIEKGEFGAFKKCPFCAESVRKEALKCKHCGSELKTAES
ncbi:MAG: hypothetical protein Q8M05_13225 [Rhodoferax sp.]|uniref:hypothetical protein n=1 Tax=Rhodoferax sp. TaxID=50421 RepID=UPI00272F15CB|nr:hypothetical protein [Rhodoferax sp.]MDP1530337.1 hypothetical protein [Rhodoferax sp.]MDP1943317.1 hypothetical protein [Rhodoferax sp.]